MKLGNDNSGKPGHGGLARSENPSSARRNPATGERPAPVPIRRQPPAATTLINLQRLAGNSAVSAMLSKENGSLPALALTPTSVLVLQRSPGDLDARGLLLSVVVGGSSVSWEFPTADLGTGAVEFLRHDRGQIAAIEQQIIKTLQGPNGKLSEAQAYLESPPVAGDLRNDIKDWPAKRALTRLPARLTARAAAVKATRLRYPLESLLASSAGISPGDIDWRQEIAAMRAKPIEWTTMIEASRADRFELALRILEAEAAVGRQPVAGIPSHTAVIRPIVYAKYAATDPAPSELQTDEMTKTHSEAFLARWLPKIRDVRLVPDGFDLSGFAPTGDLDPVRKALVARYIDEAAPRTMEKYLLDLWVADPSRRMPEQFIRTADIGAVRSLMLQHLTKDFHRWAVLQPGFRGAFWADVGQRAAFTAVTSMFASARALQSFNAKLGDRFEHTPMLDLTQEEYGIAKDPFRYSERLDTAAAVTNGLVSRLVPGKSLESSLIGWYQGIAATWSLDTDESLPAAGLLALFQILGGLKSTVEAQQKNVNQQLSRDMNASYPKIEQIIRNEAKYAEDFLKNKWIPMLKTVALEQITANRDEMKQHLAKWPEYRAQAAAKFRICAHVLEDLSNRLKSGDLDSIELNGQVLTKAHLPELEKARDFMQGQADVMTDDSKAADKKDEMQEAVDSFEKVRKRILSGEYKPFDYTKAVYNEARKRLGIDWYEDYITMGMALDRWAVVPQNPFLAYAIARWQWEERVKELDKSFKLFLVLGLLTVASCVVPGAAGVALAAVDVAVGVAHGIGAVQDAYALLDLAKLDDKQSVRGVTVEQARAALKTAWIGLGLNILLGGAGMAALFGRLIMKGRGAAKIPGDLTHLSALAKVNPIAAEQMIAKVKDLYKLDELLKITGDSLLLERMLGKTTNVRHLEFVLMHGDPRKMMELIDVAGDSTKLGNVLAHAPNAATAEKLMRLTDDMDGLALLLKNSQHAGIAEELVSWTTPQLANTMLARAPDQTALLRLKRTGVSPEVAAQGLTKADNVDELTALVAKMDSGPDQVGKLLKDRTVKEVEAMLAKGARPRDVEVGVGAPLGARPQPAFPINKVDLPADVRAILERYGIADNTIFAKLAPHEIDRVQKVMGANRLPKEARDILTRPGVDWALAGAGDSAGEFVNRWEYFSRVKWKEEREAVGIAARGGAYRNQNLDRVTAGLMANPAKMAELTQQLGDAQKAINQLAGKGWVDLGARVDANTVKASASQLTFGGETAAAYHVQVHYAELAPVELAPPGTGVVGQTSAYIGSARRTIAEGRFLGVEPRHGALTYTFERSVPGPGGLVTRLQTKVVVRDGWALIATHSKPLGGR